MLFRSKPNNHPINDVHTNLESFILFNDSGLNDVDSQLVEVEDVLEISNCIRLVLEKEKENLPSVSEQPSDKAEESSNQNQEVAQKVETKKQP